MIKEIGLFNGANAPQTQIKQNEKNVWHLQTFKEIRGLNNLTIAPLKKDMVTFTSGEKTNLPVLNIKPVSVNRKYSLDGAVKSVSEIQDIERVHSKFYDELSGNIAVSSGSKKAVMLVKKDGATDLGCTLS